MQLSLEFWIEVVLIRFAAWKHQCSRGEVNLMMSHHHKDFETIVTVSDQHDGGGGDNGCRRVAHNILDCSARAMFAYAWHYGKLAAEGSSVRNSVCAAAAHRGEPRIMSSIAPPDRRTQTLNTRRLLLRPIEPGDHDALLALWRDPDVRRYLWDNQVISSDQVSSVQAASDICFESFGAGLYCLLLQSNPEQLAGFCGYRDFEATGTPELLYGMYPEHWGRGLVNEAAAELLRYGFDECEFERVVAATDTPNQPSVRVMQRLGMTFDERKRWHGLDTVFYSLSRAEFQRP